MNPLEKHLSELSPRLYSLFLETKNQVTLLLNTFSYNFPTYTDHSISHTSEVFNIASELLTINEINTLNEDETYILSMACILHDIGMCIPEEKINEIAETDFFSTYKTLNPTLTKEEYIRDLHHILSNKFIQQEWENLKIPSKKYANAIGIVAEGHRKVDLGNFEIFDPKYFAKSGKVVVCLPYLACILRIADELDVTNSRTPQLLSKYYMPNNENSIKEWSKHISTSQRNYIDHKVIFEIECSDQNIYAALQDQFEKIQTVINYCQKVIRSIPSLDGINKKLNLNFVDIKYNLIGFDPKGIKFSFDVQNVVKAFIGEDLYGEKLTALREAVQNSIDSCRYKASILESKYIPLIKITLTEEYLEIEDNGIGMDEFIIENFFSKLGSSYYEQEKIKSSFEAIGQFGVGVFSYFLLSEYVDIETKTDSNHALKFRFDSDPKGYFNFYPNSLRKTSGTTTRLYLKSTIKETIEPKQIKNYLEKIFLYIEIPLELNLKGTKSKIESHDFSVDFQKHIKPLFKNHINKNFFNQIDYQEVYINEESFEGRCFLICMKEYDKRLTNFEKQLSDRSEESNISISQKGVYVTDEESETIRFLYGEINLKKKVKINIDRNQFSEYKVINKIIQKFQTKLLEKLFLSFKNHINDEKNKLAFSNYFINTYIDYFDPSKEYTEDLKQIIIENIYIETLKNKEIKICSISEIIKNNSEIIILRKEGDYLNVASKTDLTILLSEKANRLSDIYFYYNYIFRSLLKTNQNLLVAKDYIIISQKIHESNKSIKENINKIKQFYDEGEIISATGLKLVYQISSSQKSKSKYSFDDELIYNYNHSFIQFIIENNEIIANEIEYKKNVQSIFEIISLNYPKKINKGTLTKINKLITNLNQINRLKYLSTDDF